MTLLPVFNALANDADLTEDHKYILFTRHHMNLQAWDRWTRVYGLLPNCHPSKGPWIAGGSVRRLMLDTDPFSADIDYFTKDKQQFDILCSRLEMKNATQVQATKDHTTFQLGAPEGRLTIQVVKSRYRNSLREHLDEFDFTICQTGWDGEFFMVSVQAWHDLQHKMINCTGVYHNPVGSLIRLAKYYQQGYAPTHHAVMSILEASKEKDIQDGYAQVRVI